MRRGARSEYDLVLHFSKLFVWGSSWGRGFRFHCLEGLDAARRRGGGVPARRARAAGRPDGRGARARNVI